MPLELIVAVVLTIGGFGALGIIVGVYAQSWDNQSFINNIVILPLIFLGGVFYSVSRLGTPWEQISHLNPLFYVVEAVRYGFLGAADVSPGYRSVWSGRSPSPCSPGPSSSSVPDTASSPDFQASSGMYRRRC